VRNVKVNLALRLGKYHEVPTYSVIKQAARHEDIWGSEGIAVQILKIDSIRIHVEMSGLLHSPGKGPHLPFGKYSF
jgi:hypothetical protein